jgi:hypothetical protein
MKGSSRGYLVLTLMLPLTNAAAVRFKRLYLGKKYGNHKKAPASGIGYENPIGCGSLIG